jgi:predicted neutral ceramidase superfamily lipid hydrolase
LRTGNSALSATGGDDAVAQSLSQLISAPDTGWSLATGLSLLVWFIYAPHCLATLATVRRETGSWKFVAIMTGYLFGLAYLMSFLTYQIASRFLFKAYVLRSGEMIEYLIIAVLVIWSALVVFKRSFRKHPVRHLLRCRSFVNSAVGICCQVAKT